MKQYMTVRDLRSHLAQVANQNAVIGLAANMECEELFIAPIQSAETMGSVVFLVPDTRSFVNVETGDVSIRQHNSLGRYDLA